jgi:hypothetical protein
MIFYGLISISTMLGLALATPLPATNKTAPHTVHSTVRKLPNHLFPRVTNSTALKVTASTAAPKTNDCVEGECAYVQVLSSGKLNTTTIRALSEIMIAKATAYNALKKLGRPKVGVIEVEAPNVEVPTVEVPKVEVPKVEVSEVEAPEVEVHTVELPKVEAPKVEVPKVEVSEVEVPEMEAPAVEVPKLVTPPEVNIVVPPRPVIVKADDAKPNKVEEDAVDAPEEEDCDGDEEAEEEDCDEDEEAEDEDCDEDEEAEVEDDTECVEEDMCHSEKVETIEKTVDFQIVRGTCHRRRVCKAGKSCYIGGLYCLAKAEKENTEH